MTDKPSYDVFLSYSTRDKEWVSSFSKHLTGAGISVWLDTANLAPGDRWQERIQEALRDSKALIVILDSNTVSSPWLFFELGAAVASRKRIIPIVKDDVDLNSVPVLLRQYQFVREASPFEAGKRVAEAIAAAGASQA